MTLFSRTARDLFGFSALAAAAMLTWLWSRQGIDNETQAVPPPSAPPGYYLRGASILGTDEEGRTLYRIRAANAEELPEEKRLLLSDITVEYQPEFNVPWVLTAAAGEAFLEETYLDFSGEVELSRNRPTDSGPTAIRAVQLRLEPESFDIHTDGPVSLFIGGQRLDAVGLRANLKIEHMALESNVHGEFDP